MVPLESGVICRDSLLPHSIYANPGLLNLKWSYASLDLIIWLPSAIFIQPLFGIASGLSKIWIFFCLKLIFYVLLYYIKNEF